MRVRDRVAAVIKGGKAVYNDVASPLSKIVDLGTDNRHKMLCSMWPGTWTPLAERIVDFLMGVTDDEFAVLCHHDGLRLVMNHAKLDMIGDAIGDDETVTFVLSDVDLGADDDSEPKLPALDDLEATDAELAAIEAA